MSLPIVAGVAVENTAYSFDKLFYYLIPETMAQELSIGCRVLVDFGNSSKSRQGFVFELSDEKNVKGKLKPIKRVLDEYPLLDHEMVELASFVANRTFCTLFDSAKALLPSGMCLNVMITYRIKSFDVPLEMLSSQEIEIINYLKKKDDFVWEEKIGKDLGLEFAPEILSSLCKQGFVIRNTDTKRRLGDSTVKMASLSREYIETGVVAFKPTRKQQAVIDLLDDIGSGTTKEIAYYTGVTQSVVDGLHSHGVIVYDDVETYRTPKAMLETPRKTENIELTPIQNQAYLKLKQLEEIPDAKAALLYGVTGSGKTKVYMKLVDDMVAADKGVIVLVPEISLTPQLLQMFYSRYGENVAVLHSGLSVGERTDEWKRIKNGEAKIAVGTRSASFAPVKNLSLIIIDEEQESSYKSEMSPRYHAKDVAKFRTSYNKALLVLASATPSVESYAYAKVGRYELIELNERYSKSGLPEVITVDMSVKENFGQTQTISNCLAQELKANLDCGQQSILLINRRGFNTFIACTKCKSVMMCPNCSISMTYHSANNRMMCHYCGYSEQVKLVCPDCGADTIRFSGYGTQRVEQELGILFPEARILRMDADTTTSKNSHEKAFKLFAEGHYDIMVGTQMVAKGLDFSNVTLVGVISVDQQLYNDDFRSMERTFDLLTQVVGRAGRGDKAGRAVIQTLSPENAVIELAAHQDYKQFFGTEISIRKGMVYPPYCDLCAVTFVGFGEVIVANAAKSFFNLFKDKIFDGNEDEKVIVLGPTAPKIGKISNKHRQRLIIKCKNSVKFRKIIAECLKEFSTNKLYNKITVYADMNPDSLY